MNKAEFIDYMASQQECTKVEAEKIINAFSNAVTYALGEGKEIALMGFGRFYSSKVAAKLPQKKEEIPVPVNLLKFQLMYDLNLALEAS
jgi:nucleoid DNA-binding protein